MGSGQDKLAKRGPSVLKMTGRFSDFTLDFIYVVPSTEIQLHNQFLNFYWILGSLTHAYCKIRTRLKVQIPYLNHAE